MARVSSSRSVYNKQKPGMGKRGKGASGLPQRMSRRRDTTVGGFETYGIGLPSIRRLARRGGVKRIASSTYLKAREAMHAFVDKMLGDALVYCEYAKRKTVNALDVVYALKRAGKPIYGFGG